MRQTPDSFRIRCEYDSASGEQLMRIGGGTAREFACSIIQLTCQISLVRKVYVTVLYQ